MAESRQFQPKSLGLGIGHVQQLNRRRGLGEPHFGERVPHRKVACALE